MGSNEQTNTDPRVLREERELKGRVRCDVRAAEVRAGDLMRTAGGLVRVERVSKRSEDRVDGSDRIDLFTRHMETGKSDQWPGFFPDVVFCVYRIEPPPDPLGDAEGWAGAPAEFVKPGLTVSWDKGDRVWEGSWYTSLADVRGHCVGSDGAWIKHASWPGRVAFLAERAKAEASKTAEKYTVCERVEAGRLCAGDKILLDGRLCEITRVVRWPASRREFTGTLPDGSTTNFCLYDSDLVTVPCSKAPAGVLTCPEPSAPEWVNALPDGSDLRVGDMVRLTKDNDSVGTTVGMVISGFDRELVMLNGSEHSAYRNRRGQEFFWQYHAPTRAKLDREAALASVPIGVATNSAKAGESAGIALVASSAASRSDVVVTPKPSDDLEALRIEAKLMLDEGHDPRDVLGALDDLAHTAKHSKRSPPVETFRSLVSSVKRIHENANMRLAREQAGSARCYHGNRAQTCAWCALARQRSDASVCVSLESAWETQDCEGE